MVVMSSALWGVFSSSRIHPTRKLNITSPKTTTTKPGASLRTTMVIAGNYIHKAPPSLQAES